MATATNEKHWRKFTSPFGSMSLSQLRNWAAVKPKPKPKPTKKAKKA